jgi:hypothetical protein
LQILENSTKLNNNIVDIMSESTELKTLSDGFQAVLNHRDVKRTIVSPPIKFDFIYNTHHIVPAYLFDNCDKGIGFYFLDDITKINIVEDLEFTMKILESEKKELEKYTFKVIYALDKGDGRVLCGAKRV